MKKGILINDTSNEHHIGCDTVIANIKRLCLLHEIEIINSFTRKDVRVPMKCNQTIKDCDIVIINGEGSLHDTYGSRFLQPLLDMIPKGKKTVLINTLWYKMGSIVGINKLSLISFRETRSYNEFMNGYVIQAKGMTFLITPDVIFWRKKKNLHIGYGDSVYGNIASKLDKHGNYFPLDYRRKFSINLPPNNVKPNDVNGYLQWLKTLDLHITGRFHGICLSAMAGAPFLALASNAGKIEAILKDMGCKPLLIKSVDEIEAKKYFAHLYIPHAKMYATNAVLKIEQLFRRIKDIAYGKN